MADGAHLGPLVGYLVAMMAATVAIVTVHELFHWLPAKLLSLNPVFTAKPWWSPSVSYANNGQYWKILVTAALPAVCLGVAGLLLPSRSLILLYVQALCLANPLNLLPFTTDGQVIILAIAHLTGAFPSFGVRRTES